MKFGPPQSPKQVPPLLAAAANGVARSRADGLGFAFNEADVQA